MKQTLSTIWFSRIKPSRLFSLTGALGPPPLAQEYVWSGDAVVREAVRFQEVPYPHHYFNQESGKGA